MGAFPVSLIALGQIRRRHFDDTLTLRPKRTMNATEELESPQKIEIAALTEPGSTTEPGARANPPPIMKTLQPPNISFAFAFSLLSHLACYCEIDQASTARSCIMGR